MAAPHNKIVISGTLPGGEVWSVNPNFTNNDGSAISSFADLQTWAAATVVFFNGVGFSTALKGLMSLSATINAITAQYYDASGNLIQAANATFATPLAGTGALTKSQRDCVVLSLLTGRPGRSYRGRLYWPALAANLDSTTGRLSSPTPANIATGTAAMLNGIKSAAPAPYVMGPVVVSLTKSVATPITIVSVGNALDTQRRRTDAWVEAYSTAPI